MSMIRTTERSIRRINRQLEPIKHYNEYDHTFHGGYTLGYNEGHLRGLEDNLDDLVAIKQTLQGLIKASTYQETGYVRLNGFDVPHGTSDGALLAEKLKTLINSL